MADGCAIFPARTDVPETSPKTAWYLGKCIFWVCLRKCSSHMLSLGKQVVTHNRFTSSWNMFCHICHKDFPTVLISCFVLIIVKMSVFFIGMLFDGKLILWMFSTMYCRYFVCLGVMFIFLSSFLCVVDIDLHGIYSWLLRYSYVVAETDWDPVKRRRL